MLLHLQTWPDVEKYLKTRTDIIIPIGSTEQHGPNGLIGTDAICAEVIAKEVGEVVGALVGPTISVGMAQHHLGFPGSITLRPTTLISVIRDYVTSLTTAGFTTFYFINGHGGNIATATAAFSEIYADFSLGARTAKQPIKCMLRSWWESKKIAALSKELYANAEGSHATPSEVSLTWHAYPESARPMELNPAIAPAGQFTDANDFRNKFADGRIGSNPGLSSVEAGKRILEVAVADIAEEYKLNVLKETKNEHCYS